MNGTEAVPRILVVDDDAEIRELVGACLVQHGFAVVLAGTVAEADRQLTRVAIDLVILDVMMPGEDGLSYCRRLATATGPAVVLLSALGSSTDRIVGLEIGADAYVPKPCDTRELVATVRAVLRRSALADGTERQARHVEFASWHLDLLARNLRTADGVVVELSNGEFLLLRAFVDRPKRVLTRDQLMEAIGSADADVFDRSIDVQVSRLRRKLGPDGPNIVRTVRSEGYIFTPALVRR